MSSSVFSTRRTLLAAGFALAGTTLAGQALAQSGEPIKLGLVTALSGQSALAGESITRGMQIAIDEINEAGGVNGCKIDPILRDSQTDPKVGVDAAKALVEKGVPEKQVRMRVSQLWHWLYIRGVSDFDAMTNINKVLPRGSVRLAPDVPLPAGASLACALGLCGWLTGRTLQPRQARLRAVVQHHAMIPALPDIGRDLGVSDDNKRQLVHRVLGGIG